LIVGTLQYMAPEQLEGREADARTDIFAFGLVLYEMISGRRAFEARSQAGIISSIMTSDAPCLSSLNSAVPPALDHVVTTCIAKDPDARWQTAHDVLLQLKWIAEAGSRAGVPAPVVASRKRHHLFLWSALAASICTAMFFAWLHFWLASSQPNAGDGARGYPGTSRGASGLTLYLNKTDTYWTSSNSQA